MPYAASFRNCRISILGFFNGSRRMVLHHIFFLKFGSSWTTRFRTNNTACSLPWLRSLRLLYLQISKSIVCATEGSDPQDSQRRIQNGFETIRTTLEFPSESGYHRSDGQRPALTIKVETLERLCRPKVVTRKPRFKRPMFKQYQCLVLWCRFTYCKFGSTLFVHLVRPVEARYGKTNGLKHVRSSATCWNTNINTYAQQPIEVRC